MEGGPWCHHGVLMMTSCDIMTLVKGCSAVIMVLREGYCGVIVVSSICYRDVSDSPGNTIWPSGPRWLPCQCPCVTMISSWGHSGVIIVFLCLHHGVLLRLLLLAIVVDTIPLTWYKRAVKLLPWGCSGLIMTSLWCHHGALMTVPQCRWQSPHDPNGYYQYNLCQTGSRITTEEVEGWCNACWEFSKDSNLEKGWAVSRSK